MSTERGLVVKSTVPTPMIMRFTLNVASSVVSSGALMTRSTATK